MASAFLTAPVHRSARAHSIAAGPSVISRKARLGGYFVVFRKSMTVAVVPPGCTCQWLGSPKVEGAQHHECGRQRGSDAKQDRIPSRRWPLETLRHTEADQHYPDPRQDRVDERQLEGPDVKRHLRVQRHPERSLLEQCVPDPEPVEIGR